LKMLLVAGAFALAPIATGAFGSTTALASCVGTDNVLIAYDRANSSIVIKASDSCYDLNEYYAFNPYWARGQYRTSDGTWHDSGVGDQILSTGPTLRVLVSNLLPGTPLRAYTKYCSGCSTRADYLY